MSAKLNALNSDSYTDVSQYRDQHFKVSSSDLYKVIRAPRTRTLYLLLYRCCAVSGLQPLATDRAHISHVLRVWESIHFTLIYYYQSLSGYF